MTPLGCPDCLLIRYEPRALRTRLRARGRAPSCIFGPNLCRSTFLACFFRVNFFRVHDVRFAYESREFVANLRMSLIDIAIMKSSLLVQFHLLLEKITLLLFYTLQSLVSSIDQNELLHYYSS